MWAQTEEGHRDLIAYQTAAIRRCKPLVVVGHDENGEYGHRMHVMNTEYLKLALELAADPAAEPESYELYGAWDTPKTYLHLYGENPTVLDYETPLKLFDDRTAHEVACDAYKLCVSQYQLGKHQVQTAEDPYDSHLFGLYRSLVGDDAEKNDLFENLAERLAERH